MISFADCHLSFEDLRDNNDLRDDKDSKLCDLCKTKWGKLSGIQPWGLLENSDVH